MGVWNFGLGFAKSLLNTLFDKTHFFRQTGLLQEKKKVAKFMTESPIVARDRRCQKLNLVHF